MPEMMKAERIDAGDETSCRRRFCDFNFQKKCNLRKRMVKW